MSPARPLVIFDCDGVLVDSEPIASAAFADHLQAAGLPFSAEACRQHFTGLSLASCQRRLATEFNFALPPGFFERLQEDTYARFARELQAIDGVASLLAWLADTGIPFCVASSGSLDKMQFTLGHTGLLGHFADRLFSASAVSRGKPAPDLFLHAASSLQATPSHCLVIEDSGPGIAAGLAAGMQVCAFRHPVAVADTVALQDMSELRALLARWPG